MTDFRALCAELVDELEDWIAYGDEADCADAHAVVDRARAALAQLEPQGPTDEECIKAAFVMGQTGASPSEIERLAFEAWMRGHSWLVAGKWNGITYVDPQERHSSVNVPAMQTRMLWAAWRDRATLACPAIEPVPFGERLPGLNDVDENGNCWLWDREGYFWDWTYIRTRTRAEMYSYTHWLPHHALPVPQQEVDRG